MRRAPSRPARPACTRRATATKLRRRPSFCSPSIATTSRRLITRAASKPARTSVCGTAAPSSSITPRRVTKTLGHRSALGSVPPPSQRGRSIRSPPTRGRAHGVAANRRRRRPGPRPGCPCAPAEASARARARSRSPWLPGAVSLRGRGGSSRALDTTRAGGVQPRRRPATRPCTPPAPSSTPCTPRRRA